MGAKFTKEDESRFRILEQDRRFLKVRPDKKAIAERVELEKIQAKTRKSVLKSILPKSGKRSKYGNKKTVVGNITFDSVKEAKRWQELTLLQRSGKIRNLERQVNIGLAVNDIHVCGFKPDFRYFDVEKGREVVEDVKGYRDARHGAYAIFRIKAKLFRAVYGFDVVEI